MTKLKSGDLVEIIATGVRGVVMRTGETLTARSSLPYVCVRHFDEALAGDVERHYHPTDVRRAEPPQILRSLPGWNHERHDNGVYGLHRWTNALGSQVTLWDDNQLQVQLIDSDVHHGSIPTSAKQARQLVTLFAMVAQELDRRTCLQEAGDEIERRALDKAIDAARSAAWEEE